MEDPFWKMFADHSITLETALVGRDVDPIESVEVQDENGDSMSVKYAELAAKVLPPQQGRVTIVVSLNREFDGSGTLAHLYQAVAENVVFNVLGGWPPELEKAVLLPRSQTGKLPSLDQLRQQWIDVVDPRGHPPA